MATSKTKVSVAGTVAAAIIAAVISVEGGFTEDPKDRGNWTSGVIGQGELKGTKYGISAMAYPSVDIKSLTQEEATNLYIRDYITKPGYGDLINLSPVVGQKVVDVGVNTGNYRASLWFQTSMNSLSRDGKDFPKLILDGKIGKGSVSAYASLQKVRGKVKACELTLKLLDAQQATHYMGLSTAKDYLVGWVDHRVGNLPLTRCLEDR